MTNSITFSNTFGSNLNDVTATVTALNVNGADGLRALARSLDISSKGVRKAELVELVSATIAAKVEAELAAVTVTARIRNDNHTIAGNAAIVDGLWALFTQEGGALVNDIHALLIEGGVNVKRGTVVSRLATQRNNGNIYSCNDTDAMNRTITHFGAHIGWDKDEMARKFAKVG